MAGGGFEGENPTRRYKWFRPRQAARGYIAMNNGSNNATVGLLNNSTASQVLMVRDYVVLSSVITNPTTGFYYVQGNPGSAGGTITPMVPGQAAPPGVLWSFDDPTSRVATFDWDPLVNGSGGDGLWQHDFPFAVLPPGWSLAFQYPSSAGAMSIMWEAIYAEELDYYY